MKKKTKTLILSIVVTLVLLLTFTITYAVFSYRETGLDNQELITGDIYMRYNELSKTINISNLMPSEEYPETDYFEFQIAGKNTYNKKDIYYEIVLDNGEYEGDDLNRTIPIDSQLLKFKLVEVNGNVETEIFSNRTYSDITNKRIWVDTIGSDDGNYSKTYRLYVRIAEYTNICGGEANDNCDYYINPSEEYANLDWNKLYASIKVNVKGDFEEKSIETDGSCFGYEVASIANPTVNPVMATQTYEENELLACFDYYYGTDLDQGSTLVTFCQGSGTSYGYTIHKYLENMINDSIEYDYDFLEYGGQYLLDAGIIVSSGDSYIVNPIMATQTINELAICANYFSDETLDDETTAETFCKGTGTLNGNTFQTNLNNGTFAEEQIELFELDIINGEIGEIKLISYDETCGVDVVVPREIDGYSIKSFETIIPRSSGADWAETVFRAGEVENVVLLDNITEIGANAFEDNGIKTIDIPDSVTIIGKSAFRGNNLEKLIIPKSVTTIEMSAFEDNPLTNVTFEENSSLTTIGTYAFAELPLNSIVIPKSVITIKGRAFEDSKLTSVIFEENSSLTTIEGYAFSNNQLTGIVIPKSVITIEGEAFFGNKLTSVIFEENTSITEIGFSAFANNQLQNINIPDSVTTIGSKAFKNNNLESVTIGSGIVYIDEEAFSKSASSNSNLSTITFTSKTCAEIKAIKGRPMIVNKYFPWLAPAYTFYLEDYRATIIGTDGVCDY